MTAYKNSQLDKAGTSPTGTSHSTNRAPDTQPPGLLEKTWC